MKLTGTDIRVAYFVLARFRRQEILAGRRVDPMVTALMERLDRAVRFGMSPARQPIGTNAENLIPEQNAMELIGSQLAADILGWSMRKVQRHRADLGGRLVNGRLWFRASAVRNYRDELEDAQQQ